MIMGHWWVLEDKLGLHLAVLKVVNAEMVQIWEFLMSKFALHFEKIMYKDFNITFKVLPSCCTLANSTILSSKMISKVSQGRKFHFQA